MSILKKKCNCEEAEQEIEEEKRGRVGGEEDEEGAEEEIEEAVHCLHYPWC